ncbi:MAG: extracellular solute-binding protein [Patescibacteria group bacterium]
MSKIKNKKIFLAIGLSLALVLVLTGLGCKKQQDAQKTPAKKITINWWRLWDASDVFSSAIESYEKAHPNVKIEYKKLTYPEYENAIIESLASGKGPDIWSIHNTWILKHLDKLAPAPKTLLTPQQYQETFVDVAAEDFIITDQVYGLPFSVDTLALYYNKDLFNTAAIVSPPATWEEFKEDVKKLTKTDEAGNIIQAGAALGTAKNVNRAVDVLYLLMLQNGTQMISQDKKSAVFNQKVKTKEGETFIPGLDALIFYTDFANPKKTVYAWNPNMPNSIDAFVDEKTAMIFNYSYQDATIKSKAPKLNYAIASCPQIEADPQKAVNFANYWGEVVSSASSNRDVAWDFLLYLAKKENMENYARLTKRPASRRDIIESQLEDPDLKIFAKQALSAKSWYQKDAAAIESIFSETIESVVLGETTAEDALNKAVVQMSALMR